MKTRISDLEAKTFCQSGVGDLYYSEDVKYVAKKNFFSVHMLKNLADDAVASEDLPFLTSVDFETFCEEEDGKLYVTCDFHFSDPSSRKDEVELFCVHYPVDTPCTVSAVLGKFCDELLEACDDTYTPDNAMYGNRLLRVYAFFANELAKYQSATYHSAHMVITLDENARKSELPF